MKRGCSVLSASLLLVACNGSSGGGTLGDPDSGLSAGGSAGSDAGAADAASTDAPASDLGLPARAATPWPERVDDCDFGELTDRTAVLLEQPGEFLVVDSTHVYFTQQEWLSCGRYCSTLVGGPLLRVPRCGGAPETLLAGPERIALLSAGGRYLYWKYDDLVRFDKETRQVTRFGLDATCITAFASSPEALYFDDQCTPGLRRLAHGSNEAELLVSDAAPPPPPVRSMGTPSPGTQTTTIAVNSAHLYWIASDQVHWLDLTTGERGSVRTSSPPTAIAVDHGALFVSFGSGAGTTVSRIMLDASGVEPLHNGSAALVALDSPHVFWSTLPSLLSGSLSTIAHASSTAPLEPDIVAADRSIYGAAAYGRRLYWSNNGALLTAVREPLRVPAPIDSTAPEFTRRYPGWPSFSHTALEDSGAFVAMSQGNANALLGGDPTVVERRIIVAHFDAAGERGWTTLLGDPDQSLFPGCLASTMGGYFAVWSADTTRISFLSASGAAQWEHSEPADSPYTCATGADGALLLPRSTTIQSPTGARVAVGLHAISAAGKDRVISLMEGLDVSAFARIDHLARATDGALFAAGGFSGGVVAGSIALAASDTSQAFILQLRATGDVGWAFAVRGGDVRGLATTPGGGVAAMGAATANVHIADRVFTVAYPGDLNVWLAMFAADGTLQWLQTFPGSFFGSTDTRLLAATSDGDLLLMAESSVTPAYLGVPNAVGSYLNEPFLARFDASGRWLHTRVFPADVSTVDLHLHAGSQGRAWVFGHASLDLSDAYLTRFAP